MNTWQYSLPESVSINVTSWHNQKPIHNLPELLPVLRQSLLLILPPNTTIQSKQLGAVLVL